MTYDLCATGNALVDIIAPADDAFLTDHSIAKGIMNLIDDARATALLDRSAAVVEMTSGGSAGNTVAGFASLGGSAAFIGKVGKDKFGEVFAHDLRAQKIHFASHPSEGLPTGRCIIFVTPDAQRSMNTCLGAAGELSVADIEPDIVRNSAVTYLEGYLFDKDPAKQAYREISRLVHGANKKLGLTLSDVFCIQRHHGDFLDLVEKDVDILFANENEIMELYKTPDLQSALKKLQSQVEIGVVTRGAHGAAIVAKDVIHDVPAEKATAVIDSTGAGDLYAAGFLFGLTRGKALPECGRIGAIAAAEAISHYGPRPQKKLSDLI